MRNKKGISVIKLIIIIAIIILGIIFIVAMSKTQNGIKSLEEETKEWQDSQKARDKAIQDAKDAEKIYNDSLTNLKELGRTTII